MRVYKAAFWIIISAIVAASCAPAFQNVSRTASGEESAEIKKIAAAPVFFASEQAEGAIGQEKRRLAADLFYAQIAPSELPSGIVPADSSRAEYERIKRAGASEFEALFEAAANLSADAVLVGNISEYRERDGGEFGIKSPAAVALGVQLLSIKDGTVIWEAHYSETQRPLLENVAKIGKFLKRRARWVTRDELLREGIAETARKFRAYLAAKSAKGSF
ncbi:MAG: hypothetical protein ACT4NX_06145 [Deltaproteobacteria bacterium]